MAAVGLSLPWIKTGAAALSFSAFDLAEWTTIIPEVRYGGNAMTLPYHLRLLVVVLIGLVSLLPRRRFQSGWWWCAAIALAGVIGLLPPFEYFIDPGTGFRGDPNYNQLMSVAWTGLAVALIGLSGVLSRIQRVVLLGGALFGVILALVAMNEATLYANRYIVTQTGVGGWVFCAGLMLAGGVAWLWRKPKGGV